MLQPCCLQFLSRIFCACIPAAILLAGLGPLPDCNSAWLGNELRNDPHAIIGEASSHTIAGTLIEPAEVQ